MKAKKKELKEYEQYVNKVKKCDPTNAVNPHVIIPA